MKRLTNNINLGFQDSNKLPSYEGLWDRLKYYEDLEEEGRLFELPCNIEDEFYCVAYEENPRVIKVLCDGYGIIKNNLKSPEQKFLWMANIVKPFDYWKIDFSIFNEKMFLTREEAEEKLKEWDNFDD